MSVFNLNTLEIEQTLFNTEVEPEAYPEPGQKNRIPPGLYRVVDGQICYVAPMIRGAYEKS